MILRKCIPAIALMMSLSGFCILVISNLPDGVYGAEVGNRVGVRFARAFGIARNLLARTGGKKAGNLQSCSISFAPREEEIAALGGSGTIQVTASPACPWTAVSENSWITVTTGTAGMGSGTVTYSVSPNPGPERTGILRIADLSFMLRQVSSCSFALAPAQQQFGAIGGTGSVSLTTGGGCAWTAAPVERGEPELPRVYLDTTYVAPGGNIIFVPAGTDLQAAIDAAQPGDTLELQAGATFTGNFTLPEKTGSNWITIRTSAPDSRLPPPGTRITPAYADVLARIVTPNAGPALEALSRAHHYRLIGIEFTAANTAPLTFSLINLGTGETSLSNLPHDLILDRLYIHGSPTFTLRRGVTLNSASTAIVDSYISDCHEVGADSQAIGGWNGAGPFKIVNNYLEGAGENFILGGADPSIANLVPSDIEFRRNFCFKPLSWRIGDPSYNGIPWGVKNLFELKNAQRVLIEGNIFQNNWSMAQNGYGILFTVRNQDGASPWSVVQDVTFTNNIVRSSGGGVNILGMDTLYPSQPVRRIRITNNLFDDIDGDRWDGTGIVFLAGVGPRDITIDHNSMFQTRSNTYAYHLPTLGLVFQNNLMPYNTFGIKGDGRSPGNSTINTYFPGAVFQKNVFIGADPDENPAENFFPSSYNEVGLLDLGGGNYRLSSTSPYRNGGTDGQDPGCDFDLLDAALDGTIVTTTNPGPASWITITGPTVGTESGSIGFEVAPNPGPARTGSMIIGGRTLTVTQAGGCAFTLSPSQNLPTAGGMGVVTVTSTAGCAWTAKSDVPWLRITSGIRGAGMGSVEFAVAANQGPQRTGTIRIGGQNFTVTQAAGCVASLSAATQNIAAAGGIQNLQVPAAAGCAWTASSSVSWLQITAGASGTGPGSVTYSVLANTGPQRTGTMSIAGQLLTVIQAAGCTFNVSPRRASFPVSGGTGLVNVTGSFGCVWTAVSNVPWVILNLQQGGAGSGTVEFSVAANVGPQRSGTLSVAGQTVEVEQPGNCPQIDLSPSSLNPGTVGVAFSQTLTAMGGIGPYAFSATGGSLPAGLTLSPGGVLSGTPSADGTFNFTVTATAANGCEGTRSYAVTISAGGGAPAGLQFYPLPRPVRLLETRPDFPGFPLTGCFRPNSPLLENTSRLQSARGFCDGVTIPANAVAIVGNATAINNLPGSQAGFVTLYPGSATRPTASNLNYAPGEIVSNAFTAGLNATDGTFNLYVSSTIHFIVDITGYYAPPGAGGLYYHPLPRPVRLLETRPDFPGFPLSGCFRTNAPLAGNASRIQPARGSCDGITIPAGAVSIVGNATVVNPAAGGYITLYPSDASLPVVSNLNFAAGNVLSNAFTVGLGTDGAFRIFPSTGSDFIVDIAGYFSSEANDVNGAGLLFYPLDRPLRLLETRPDFPGFPLTGCFRPNAPLSGNASRTQPARIVCEGITIPATAQAILGNATVVNNAGAQDGYITLYPSDVSLPIVANLNFLSGQIIPNAFSVGLGSDGAFKIYASASTHFIVDLTGYFAP